MYTAEIITVVRRYDNPDSFGFHFFDIKEDIRQGFLEVESPYLTSPDTCEIKIAEILSGGYTEDTTPPSDMDDTMKRIVRRSCPIEFHRSLAYLMGERGSDQHGEISDTVNIAGRIRVFTKEVAE